MAIKNVIVLLANAAASSAAIPVALGGTYSWSISGTFSGATIKLQILGPDGATFIDIPSASFTAAGVMSVDLPQGTQVKAVVTAGPPSAIYSNLSLIRG